MKKAVSNSALSTNYLTWPFFYRKVWQCNYKPAKTGPANGLLSIEHIWQLETVILLKWHFCSKLLSSFYLWTKVVWHFIMASFILKMKGTLFPNLPIVGGNITNSSRVLGSGKNQEAILFPRDTPLASCGGIAYHHRKSILKEIKQTCNWTIEIRNKCT